MSDLKEAFEKGSKASVLYKRVSRLEKAGLVKVRYDGFLNWIEITAKGKASLKA